MTTRSDRGNGNRAIELWLAFGERGRSSEGIAFAALGIKVDRQFDWPRDPDDLRRCLRLLDAAPAARPGLEVLAAGSPEWAALVAVWPALDATLREETHELLDLTGSAPRTYAMMREALEGAKGGQI